MRLLDRDPWGVETRFEYDWSTGGFGIERWMDAEKPLEHAHELRSLNDGYSPSRELKRRGGILVTDYEEISKKIGMPIARLPAEEREKIYSAYFAAKPYMKTAPNPQPYRKPWQGSINAPTAGELVRRGY